MISSAFDTFTSVWKIIRFRSCCLGFVSSHFRGVCWCRGLRRYLRFGCSCGPSFYFWRWLWTGGVKWIGGLRLFFRWTLCWRQVSETMKFPKSNYFSSANSQNLEWSFPVFTAFWVCPAKSLKAPSGSESPKPETKLTYRRILSKEGSTGVNWLPRNTFYTASS